MSASHRRGLAGDRLTSQWSDGDQIYVTAHVSFGSLADICNACTLVCSTPNSDRKRGHQLAVGRSSV